MKTAIKKVTPEWAANILEYHNKNNRNINKGRVAMFLSDMRRGTFPVTHQGIALDEDGELLDGQNRLTAVVEFGQPVEMQVTTGMKRLNSSNGKPFDIRDAIDRGQPRSVAQQLQMAYGVTNANYTAAICAVIRNLCCGSVHNKGVSVSQCLEIYRLFQKQISSVMEQNWTQLYKKSGFLGVMVLANAVDPDAQTAFAESIIGSIPVPERHPSPRSSGGWRTRDSSLTTPPRRIWRKLLLRHSSSSVTANSPCR